MKVNVAIDLSDEQRNALYCWMTGKEVKKMASRADVRELVEGVLDGVLDQATAVEPIPSPRSRQREDIAQATHPHRKLIEANIKQRGYTDAQAKGYWRGWTMKPFRR